MTPTNSPFANVKAGVENAAAVAAKVAPTIVADVAEAKAEVVAVDGKLTAFIKNNAGKIAIAVLVGGALLVWKLI